MLIGFVVIVYPEKYISMPDVVQDDFSRAAEEMEEVFINETNTEIAAATNQSEIERIESGNISSNERFHYLERLKDAQDEGVEGMCISFTGFHPFLNFNIYINQIAQFDEKFSFSSYNYGNGDDRNYHIISCWSSKGKSKCIIH